MISNRDFDEAQIVRIFCAEQIRLNASQTISRREFRLAGERIRVDIMAHALDTIVLSIDGYIHGMTDERITIHEQWPETWWDAVKVRWFPRWALKRWPAQFREIDIDRPLFYAVCPHLQSDERNRHLQWMASAPHSFDSPVCTVCGYYEDDCSCKDSEVRP